MRSQDGFSGLFFAPLPNLEELIAVEAVIRAEKDDEISAIQPKCCREIIFTEPKVLLSPLLDDRNKLFLITQEMIFHSSEFQELLQRLKIKETERVDLTKGLFQFCFLFTMKQKLAPLWNKAGEFLVQGRDFMLEKTKLNAVSLEVTISDKISIGLLAYSLKSSPCMPEYFTASTRTLEEFNTNEKAVITEAAISDDLCFVLPSLKKGRIFSITHYLPEECPFASYEDLRKHWKLMYGYRLPAEENVFYNVEDFPREEPPAKKPKSKPKIQDNIDVRELALQDQLQKVNAVTLTDWLKKRGVAVKSKDKKTELTSKVKLYLATIPHEP